MPSKAMFVAREHVSVYAQQTHQAMAVACVAVGAASGGGWAGLHPHATGHDLQWLALPECLCRSRNRVLCLPSNPTTYFE